MPQYKLKPLVLTLTVMLLSAMSHAQKLAPQALTSTGIKMTQSNGSVSFTVGELFVKNQTDSNGNTLGNGFTNSATGSTTILPVTIPDGEILNVSVYPNPTTDLLTVVISGTSMSRLIIEMTDLQGKTICTSQYIGISNKIYFNTSNYAKGTYFLILKEERRKVLGSYKIIKH
jgi:hypothetical protein